MNDENIADPATEEIPTPEVEPEVEFEEDEGRTFDEVVEGLALTAPPSDEARTYAAAVVQADQELARITHVQERITEIAEDEAVAHVKAQVAMATASLTGLASLFLTTQDDAESITTLDGIIVRAWLVMNSG